MIRAVSANGAVIEGMDYGAFGERRGYTDPTLPAAVPQTTTRGFTGHEMIDGTDVVHMNGRIYDSKLGRFLQADPVIQEPNNPQNFNRYTYVLNNPLSLTDPSGFSFFGKIGNFFKKYGTTIAAIAINVYLPGAGGLLAAAGIANPLAQLAIAGFLSGLVTTGTLKGGLTGAFTAAVGLKITNIPGIDNFGNAFLQGALNGGVSVLSGGDFGHAFAAAGFSAFASGTKFVQGLKALESKVAVSAIIGGTASELTGGKFANGAVTGAMTTALAEIGGLGESRGDGVNATVTACGSKYGCGPRLYGNDIPAYLIPQVDPVLAELATAILRPLPLRPDGEWTAFVQFRGPVGFLGSSPVFTKFADDVINNSLNVNVTVPKDIVAILHTHPRTGNYAADIANLNFGPGDGRVVTELGVPNFLKNSASGISVLTQTGFGPLASVISPPQIRYLPRRSRR